jgi:hypothetical protein
MRKLDFLVGKWTLSVEGFDRRGEVVHRSRGAWETTSEMGGLILTSAGYAEDGRIAVRDWKFHDGPTDRLYDVQFDFAGHFEVRVAVPTGADLAFSLLTPFVGTDGVPRDWRKTFTRLAPDAYRVETHYTEDAGKTWILGFRESYSRTAGGNSSDSTKGPWT